MSENAIRATRLGKRYRLGHQDSQFRYGTLRDVIAGAASDSIRRFKSGGKPLDRSQNDWLWALRDVSFDIKHGEVAGIIGRNGSGKSTLLKILSRVTEPTEGRAEIVGRVASLLEVGTGFHPELTGRENIYLNAAILGMRRATVMQRFDEIVAFAEIEKHIDTAVKHYSSGMYVRLAFAVAAHLEPEILIVDEVLAVGDYAFQQKCLGRMNALGREGRTVLVVSHTMQTVVNLCPRAILLDDGRVVLDGASTDVVQSYMSRAFKASAGAVWLDPETAPGDDKVRLHSIQTRSADGTVTLDLDNGKDIIIEISYWCMRDGQKLTPAIHLTNQMDVRILESTNARTANLRTDEWYDRPMALGLYRAECVIPAEFLNEGSYRVDVGFFESGVITGGTLESFRVYDPGTVRKPDNRPWGGVVHPRLGWWTTQLSKAVPAAAEFSRSCAVDA